MNLIRKLSTAIRANRSSFETKANIEINDKHPTDVVWSKEIYSQVGANTMNEHIRFKVIVERTEKGFFKTTHNFEKIMVADAEFGKPIVFKFIDKKNGMYHVTDSFTKYTAKQLEVSLHNNRIVYFQLFDLNIESLVQYAIRFENVHKKYQFLELLSLSDIPI